MKRLKRIAAAGTAGCAAIGAALVLTAAPASARTVCQASNAGADVYCSSYESSAGDFWYRIHDGLVVASGGPEDGVMIDIAYPG